MERVIKNVRAVCMMLVAILTLCACIGKQEKITQSEMQAFEAFADAVSDSISIVPRKVRTQALQQMRQTTDSLVACHYLVVASKTCLMSSDMDSARILIARIEHFMANCSPSPRLADLQADCFNMKGNIYARTRNMDSAVYYFQKAYELRMQSTKIETVPDILTNLADANNRLGKLDVGAACYRRALLLCDSLQISPLRKTPIYYGLAQIYVTLRDFVQCDDYYELAGRNYDSMLPYEKDFYLNNRGTSYYYRGDYETAIGYFRRAIALTEEYPDMVFELNLGWLNLADCFLQINLADSAACYIEKCRPYFQKTGITTALYYIDTQDIKLSLLQKDPSRARRILANGITPSDIDPDMVHIRNRYLQHFFEENGDYRQALAYLKENNRLDDSVRNERIKMRTADLALHYQQDSTLMAQKYFIRQQKEEVEQLRKTKFFWIVFFVIILFFFYILYLYNKKKHALQLAHDHHMMSTLRLENIRNRLSPHFIFNVLNREMSERKEEERQELATLVRLMRRNLELAEQLCVTLAEELDFVTMYIDLERRSLGSSFRLQLDICEEVCPQEIYLPSMLIQIPVENAIKHALRGKEGERLLWITVSSRAKGICIRITDNGGGYRVDSVRRGTGTGMKVIMQTVQILNMKNKEAIDCSVHNVQLATGDIGCEVTFLLPYKYNYTI